MMLAEMGEYLVGAYLKLIEDCDFVHYGVRTPGGGLAGLNELDVVGINLESRTAYLCEVTTHLSGTNKRTVETIQGKHEGQKEFAKQYLEAFPTHVFMFWSPVVPRGYITDHLAQIEDLQLVINGKYKRRVNALREEARRKKQVTGNPAFRVLQILEALRD